MVTVNIACLLTFSTHTCVLSSNQHIISLLKAATNMNENLILSKNHMHMSNFLKYLIRFIERLLVPIQPTVAEILKKSSYQSLNDFSVTHWAVIRTEFSFDGEWKKRNTDIYDGWYDGQYESTCLSINCLKGIFLVNGMSISYLPEKIISNELYIRVFEHYIFPIQIAAAPNTYISRYSNFGDEPVQYEFYFDDQLNRLIVCERHIKTNEIFELIPPTCFDKELPAKFISEYSHWKNIKNPIVEFRPIHFQDPDFLNYKPYVLNIETGYVTTTETLKLQILINRSSSLFQNLYRRYFHRLDEQPYLYMMNDDASNIIERKKSETDVVIHIHLSRLAIAFKYNMSSNCFVSREYSDMCIDEDQWIGTLT
ncbi:unnamed protein product, partial [Rotaria socialis]